MITLNCDIGERGPDHPVDMELMQHIQVANLACGGHAGDKDSVQAFLELATRYGVSISAHLSYPDRENFGRQSMDIAISDLFSSLDHQMTLLSNISSVKFHGALYNDAVENAELAHALAEWSAGTGIRQVTTFPGGELADACVKVGISIVNEVFAERRYAFQPETGKLTLVARSKSYACITDVDEAVSHTRQMVQTGEVEAVIADEGEELKTKIIPIKADTVCIHSDSPIALELVKSLAGIGNSLR